MNINDRQLIKHYQEIVASLVKNHKCSYFKTLKAKYPEIVQFLRIYYPQLDGRNISEYCYWFIHDLHEFPQCKNPNCTHTVKFNSGTKGYADYCSRICMQTDKAMVLKRNQTNMIRFGVPFAQQSDKIKQKCRERLQQKKRDPTYSQKIRRKIQDAFQKRANENPNYWKDIRDKAKNTNIKNGKPPTWNNREKQRITLKKLKENPEFLQKINEKRRQTIKQNMENDPLYLQKRLDKIHQTNIRKGRPAKWINVEKIKQTKMQRFGDPYFRNSQKAKQTCLQKYGFETYTQTPEYHKKRGKKVYSTKYNMSFDSSWEEKVYDFCIVNKLKIEYQPNIVFDYSVNGIIKHYHPDFLINNKLYEVKGDHFFKDGKMICPFRYKKWTDEEYKLACDIAEAKHQCMIAHGVKILCGKELRDLKTVFIDDLRT